MSRATIRLSLACNNRCIFCAQDGLVADDAPRVAAALERARATTDEVSFVGGEPTLDEALVGHVAAARALGFRRIGVQTNGSRLADRAYAASLVDAGLTDVHLSLHGGTNAVHDYHSGRDGSFAEIVAALGTVGALRALEIGVTTVLTRSNFRVVGAIPPLLAAGAVKAWRVSVPVTAGRAATHHDRVVPRLALALPFALHAVAAADALGIDARITGAPLCLLGPFATKSGGAERAYAAACASCAARAACPGVDAGYLARFGGDELAPRAAVNVEPDPSSMFVGVGEMVPPAATPATKRALPVFGKVKPALAEASRSAARRTGSELQEILPALFEGESKG